MASGLRGHVAGKGGERRDPLSFVPGLAGFQGYPQRAKFRRAARLRSAGEDVATPGDGKVNEPRAHHRALELCFQQSAGNSTSPEGDIFLAIIGNSGLNQNVAKLQPPTGHQHPGHLG